MAHPPLPMLVTPDDLKPQLSSHDLLIVDLCSPEVYETGHVPGAVNLAYASLIREAPPAKGLIADDDALSRAFSAIGLTSDRHVVAYDDEGNGRAARLLWTLEALGHFSYSLLDGGLPAWKADGGELETGAASVTPSDYDARVVNPDVIADRETVMAALDDANSVILDARSPEEYSGVDQRAARGGHIPGAINLEWTQALDAAHERRLQPVETLRTMLKQAGVTPDKDVITHCQTHHRSALTFFVLRYLGYPRIRGYPGSWSEWGNLDDTPVESSSGREPE